MRHPLYELVIEDRSAYLTYWGALRCREELFTPRSPSPNRIGCFQNNKATRVSQTTIGLYSYRKRCQGIQLSRTCHAQSSSGPANILPRLLFLPFPNPQYLGPANRRPSPLPSRTDGLRRYVCLFLEPESVVPVFWSCPISTTVVPLRVAPATDVHLRSQPIGQNLFFHLNHPIKWIRLVGVIVALDLYPTRWIALLDDSSGATIEITCGRPAPASTTQNTNAASLAEDRSTGVGGLDASSCKGVTATGRDVDLSGMDIGTVVKVKGGVGSFRDVRQMLLERICRFCQASCK